MAKRSKDITVSFLRKTMSTKEIAQEVGVSQRLVRYWLKYERSPDRINLNQLHGIAKQRMGREDAVEIIHDKKKLQEYIKLEEKGEKGLKEELETVDTKDGSFVRVKSEKKKKELILVEKKSEIAKTGGLKEQLDEIDKRVVGEVADVLCIGRAKVFMGVWEKGKAIVTSQTEILQKVNFLKLEKETGRSRLALKTWHDIYQKYPNREKYLPIAEQKAREYIEKRSIGAISKQIAEPVKDVDGTKLTGLGDTLRENKAKCFAAHYSSVDPTWISKCVPCLTIGLCKQLQGIFDESPILKRVEDRRE